MSLLGSYLSSRSQKNVLKLLEEHSGKCKAVGHTLEKIVVEWSKGEAEALKINTKIIHTEEKSADNVERELIKAVVKSELPNTKLKEDLISFVRMVDTAAGGAKRAATNMMLLIDFPLPESFANMVLEGSKVISKIFEKIEEAIVNYQSKDKIEALAKEVDELEDKMDRFYEELKKGYFEIEKTFNSAAAMIILDHVLRDLEHAADTGEDAMDIFLELTQRRA